MAVDEAGFKLGFRKDLKTAFPEALIWTNNDMYRVGLPDFSVSWDSSYFAVEAKFARTLPKRVTSKCLTHEVSEGQLEFLNKTRLTGNYSCVLIGLNDVCVVMLELKTNYTLEEVLKAPRIERNKGSWDVSKFFSTIRGT